MVIRERKQIKTSNQEIASYQILKKAKQPGRMHGLMGEWILDG